jgi:hypothetical protein
MLSLDHYHESKRSTTINELPPVQQEILIMLRRQRVPIQHITVSLKAAGHDCPDPLPHLQALVELEFVTREALAEGDCWFPTNKGKVAAELLWFERRFGDSSRLFRALGGG